MKIWFTVLTFAIALHGFLPPPAAAEPDIIPGFSSAELDKLVERSMSTFSVPGMSLGIVKEGELIFAKGYGVRELGEENPVDPDTLFAIGSNTKAFTTAALAILVDEGKIAWDDRVIDHLPQFRLADPWVTREFTIRDLLTHRSGLGLGAGDLMMWPETDFTREEMIAGLKHLKPVTSFRSTFAYDNQLYMVAGEIIPAVTGTSWEDFVEARIFEPLDLAPCAVTGKRIQATENVASPHARVEGDLKVIEPSDISTVAAAGAIWCNITNMATWVELQLSAGKTENGTELFSVERHKEMWSPQTLMPVSKQVYEWSRTHFSAYGLGWGLSDYDGYLRVLHTGGVPGMVSWVSMLPELNLGVVVLTNQQSSAAMASVAIQIIKSFTSIGRQDWVATFAELVKEGEAEADKVIEEATAKASSDRGTPSLALEQYAGTYRDPWRGDVTIRLDNGSLVLKFSRTDKLEGAMEHYQHDTFIVRWFDRSLEADAYVKFGLSYAGEIESMTMQAVSPRTDFSYDFHDLDFVRVESR
jgi:CubicO group peptidase (beta-lactamase class C family)